MWEIERKKDFQGFHLARETWGIMDIFIILVVEMNIHMSEHQIYTLKVCSVYCMSVIAH